MEKRIFAAIGISIALLWLWAAVAPRLFPELMKKPEPVAAKSVTPARPSTTSTTGGAAAHAVPASGVAPAAPVAPISANAASVATFETDHYVARFSNRGAQLVSFQLKNYKARPSVASSAPVDLVKHRDAGRTDYPFAIEARDPALARRLNTALYAVTQEKGHIRFEYAGDDGVAASKTFRLGNDYQFQYEIAVTPAVPYRIVVGPGIRNLSPDEQASKVLVTGNGVVENNDKLKIINREKGDRLQIWDSAASIGLEDNYFLTLLHPTKNAGTILRRVDIFTPGKKDPRKDLYAGQNAMPDGTLAGTAFFGPKETKLLDRLDLGDMLQFGFFGVIARFLLEALVWINSATKNYGWAIIVLTIIIKVVLYPLQHKSIVSMKKMSKVQPKMEAIKNKYKKSKTDPEQRQKMNTEMMKLYQVEGINPMSGCLPILLQLPILWGFYGLLSRAIELRGAPFMLWIQDLSEKDPYYITPILMTATMFIQTWITPTTGDPAQRRIFLIMPIVFGWIFKEFPSGLVLYWLVQNILTIVQQWIMNKWWKEHPEELKKD